MTDSVQNGDPLRELTAEELDCVSGGLDVADCINAATTFAFGVAGFVEGMLIGATGFVLKVAGSRT